MFLINTKAVGRAGAATYDAHFLIVGGGGAGNNIGYGHMNSGGGAGGLLTRWYDASE